MHLLKIKWASLRIVHLKLMLDFLLKIYIMNQSTKEFIADQPFIAQLRSLIPNLIFSEAANTTNTDEKFFAWCM